MSPDMSGVIDELNDVRLVTGHHLPRVFRDWTALAVASFARDDERYNERLDRYATLEDDEAERREVAEAFSRALAELAVTTTEAGRPVIGDVYEEIGASSDAFGQFFSPWTLCEAKAEIAFAGGVRDATPENPIRIADPACGSARTLVAGAKALRHRDPDTPVWVQGTDKDRVCARMAVINLVLAKVPGRIRHGDSLTLEMHRAWEVRPGGLGPRVERVEPRAYDGDESSEDDTDVSFEREQAGLDAFTDGGGE